MKKILSLLIIGMILTGLVGCTLSTKDKSTNGSNNPKNESAIDDKVEEKKAEDNKDKENQEEENNKDKKPEENKVNSDNKAPIVKVEELPLSITILEPDSMGTRYLEATFTNNSKYTVKGLNITILLKDKNEKNYLSIYQTVYPGDVSPKFVTFAPNTGKTTDIEYLSYEIIVGKKEGTTVHITYDTKSDKYTWF